MAEPLLFLGDAEVAHCLPSPADAIGLADQALRSIGRGEALLRHGTIRPAPPTGFSAIYGAVRQNGSWTAGQKWVAEGPEGVAATLLVNDGESGRLHTIMDARNLTGLRTAAVSGACIAALARPGPVALIGTGLQARWHLKVLAALGWRDVRVAYRRAASGEALLDWARDNVSEVTINLTEERRAAVAGASVVVSMVTRGVTGAVIPVSCIEPQALLLPVDFAHCIEADAAGAATLLAADDLEHYDHSRAEGALPGYPAAHCSTGEALDKGRPNGLILIQNLGNAAADLAIARHVRDAATAAGMGTWLEL